jgi:hypothetical protein
MYTVTGKQSHQALQTDEPVHEEVAGHRHSHAVLRTDTLGLRRRIEYESHHRTGNRPAVCMLTTIEMTTAVLVYIPVAYLAYHQEIQSLLDQ